MLNRKISIEINYTCKLIHIINFIILSIILLSLMITYIGSTENIKNIIKDFLQYIIDKLSD